ncbi:MAG: hypothetical protein QMD97_03310 [Candidatus Aenigmarchaeota archaeon]|nr:hypothetical protein [Candidatus Aenigmarchaeota archaeon]
MLDRNKIEVVQVPPFSPHWRKHFTWKIWCWNDAPAHDILWMDSGVVVLKPIDEVFNAINKIGYFTVPTYHLLTENASVNACRGCGVDPSFREGKMTLAGTFIGFHKKGEMLEVLKEALSVALVEENIASVERMHRHDQMIISLLLYKHMGQALMSDGVVYCGWLSPRQTVGQKVWVHRRELLPKDQAHFASHISDPGQPYVPAPPLGVSGFKAGWKKVFGAPERFIRRALRGQLGKEERPYDGIRDKI